MTNAEPAQSTPRKPKGERPSVLFLVILTAILFVFIWTFSLIAPIVLSLLLILLISLAVNPVTARMRSWAGGRKGATAILTLGLIGVMGLTAWAFVVPMRDSVSNLTDQLPDYWDRIQKPLIKLEQQAVDSEKRLQEEVSSEIAREEAAAGELPDEGPAERGRPEQSPEAEPEPEPEAAMGSVRSNLGGVFDGITGSFGSVVFNLAEILIVLITVFFGVIYTLVNPRPIFGIMFALVPGRHHEKALIIAQRIGDFVPRWAGATLLGQTTIGTLVFLLMWPIFGFTDALVLGLIAFVLEAIPYIGPVLSAVPALLLALGEGGLTPLWVVLAYVLVQTLESNVTMPMIMARGMSLHPLAVIFSMLLCVAAFGVLGVLVAAPLVAIAGILHEELYRKRFLPAVTDADLDRLSRQALHEKISAAE